MRTGGGDDGDADVSISSTTEDPEPVNVSTVTNLVRSTLWPRQV